MCGIARYHELPSSYHCSALFMSCQRKETFIKRKDILLNAFLPGIFGLLGTSLYVLGDTLIVGQALGRDGLASLNLAIPMINLMQGIGLWIGFGGATAMSRSLGRKDIARAKDMADRTLTWSVLAGLALCLILQLSFDPLVRFLSGGGPALAGSRQYLGILLWFSPVYVVFQSLVVLLRNDGGARPAMIALLLASSLNVVLDAWFIFGLKWGMFGAGLATGLAQLIGLGIVLYHLPKSPLLASLRPRLASPFRLMGKGLASLIMEVSQGVVIFAFNAVLLSLAGEVGVSSYAIIANLSLMFTAIFLGLAQGAQPLFARAKGAGDEAGYQFILRFALQVGLGLSLAVVGLCLAAPRLLAMIFISHDETVIQMTLRGLRLYSLGFLFLGSNLIGTLALQSSSRALEAFLFALARGMVLLIVFLLGLTRQIGLDGVWLSFAAAELTGFLWLNLRLRKSPAAVNKKPLPARQKICPAAVPSRNN